MTNEELESKRAKKAEYQKRWRDKQKMKNVETENESVENSTAVEEKSTNVEKNSTSVESNDSTKEIELDYKPDGKPKFYCSECGNEVKFCDDNCSKCGENLDWRGVLDTDTYDDVPKFPCDKCGIALNLDDADLQENVVYACPRCGWQFKFPTGFLSKYRK